MHTLLCAFSDMVPKDPQREFSGEGLQQVFRAKIAVQECVYPFFGGIKLLYKLPVLLQNLLDSSFQNEDSSINGAVAEIEKKIIEAFEVFDQGGDKTVSIRDIGSIVRSLGCFPTEAELHELLANIEKEEPTGYIHLEKFLPVMTKVLLDRSYRPIPEDVLLHAFEALDENKCGYITKEELVKYMTGEGEPFTEEEMEDMLSTALDPETNTLHYRDYILKLIVECTEDVKEIPAVLKMMVTLEPFAKNGAELGLCLIVSWLLEESLWQAAVLTKAKAKFGLGYT
ncbi:Efcab2 [Columba guinea]|nr:Efcab2 [Columba guinea]